MKKTKLLCISLLLAFLVMFLPNIACADGSSFTSIQSYGRQVDVLAPDSFTLSDMDRNADEWRKLGCVIVYYYKDEQRRDSDLIATYQGVRNLNSAYSIADKLERTYLNSANLPPAPPRPPAGETPGFGAIFAIAALLAGVYILRRSI